MSARPPAWGWRPGKREIAIRASMQKRGLSRHAWMSWAVDRVLEAEARQDAQIIKQEEN